MSVPAFTGLSRKFDFCGPPHAKERGRDRRRLRSRIRECMFGPLLFSFGIAQEEAERTLSSPLPPLSPLFRLNCLCGKILQLCIALRVCGGQCTETNSGGLPAAFCEEREREEENERFHAPHYFRAKCHCLECSLAQRETMLRDLGGGLE